MRGARWATDQAFRLAPRSVVWRSSIHGFFAGRPLVFLGVSALVLGGVAGFTPGGDPNTVSIWIFLLTLVIAGGLVRGLVAGVRDPSRWMLLFQRPITPLAYFGRLWTMSVSALVVLFVLAGCAASIASWGSATPPRLIWGSVAGGGLMAFQLLTLGFGISALVKEHDLELTVLVFILSSTQGLLRDLLEPEWAQNAVSLVLLPINALLHVWNRLAGLPGPEVSTAQMYHAVLYPLAWLVVAVLALSSESTRDLRVRARGGAG